MANNTLSLKIQAYADNDRLCGWVYVNGYRFPKRALMHYMFGNTSMLTDMLPQYEAFSDMGYKMIGDNPFHTDVWLGAGGKLDDAYMYGTPMMDALHVAINQTEDEYGDQFAVDFTILSNTMERSTLEGVVYEYPGPVMKGCWSSAHIDQVDKAVGNYGAVRCLVIPVASMDYQLACTNADVIITEVGGPLSHMATVAREQGKLLIRINNAMSKFSTFDKISICTKTCKLLPIAS